MARKTPKVNVDEKVVKSAANSNSKTRKRVAKRALRSKGNLNLQSDTTHRKRSMGVSNCKRIIDSSTKNSRSEPDVKVANVINCSRREQQTACEVAPKTFPNIQTDTISNTCSDSVLQSQNHDNDNESSTPPYTNWFRKISAVTKREKADGHILTRGILSSGAANEIDDGMDVNLLTQSEVDCVRAIIMPERRQTTMDEMHRLVLGDQYETPFMVCNDSFHLDVIQAYNRFDIMFRRLGKRNLWVEMFNSLLGFTHAIHCHDTWMNGIEQGWGGDAMMNGLAKFWKITLSKPDVVLEIDSEFTRPGTIHLLERLKEDVEEKNYPNARVVTFKFQGI